MYLCKYACIVLYLLSTVCVCTAKVLLQQCVQAVHNNSVYGDNNNQSINQSTNQSINRIIEDSGRTRVSACKGGKSRRLELFQYLI